MAQYILPGSIPGTWTAR